VEFDYNTWKRRGEGQKRSSMKYYDEGDGDDSSAEAMYDTSLHIWVYISIYIYGTANMGL
jgi:hypothetical protein